MRKLKDSFTNDNYIKLFQNNETLTIDKTYEIFEYYLKLIFENIKIEIKKFQKNLDKESTEEIKNLNSKKNIIDIKSIAHAIRLFITLVLFLEEDKEKKIKSNLNNVINYLNAPDLWDKNIYDNPDFIINLNQLKLINAHINQIIDLYDKLGKDIEDDFCNDVIKQIENEKSNTQNKSENEERNKEDFNKREKNENDEDMEKIEESGSDEEEANNRGNRWAKKQNEEEEEEEDEE